VSQTCSLHYTHFSSNSVVFKLLFLRFLTQQTPREHVHTTGQLSAMLTTVARHILIDIILRGSLPRGDGEWGDAQYEYAIRLSRVNDLA
jgi:hypothetical protein